MKIAVIGAGIVGICTAYELAQDGHAVSVFERHSAVAEEASFACGGNQSPSLFHPLAFPAWPAASRLRALRRASGITIGRGTTTAELRWLLSWKLASADHRARLAAAHALVSYSLERQTALGLQNAQQLEQSQGQLVLMHNEAECIALQERLATLGELGTPAKLLTPDEARKLEPALGADLAFHRALYFANDAVGNCRQFGHALKDKAQDLGVAFHFNTPVSALRSGGSGVQLQTASGDGQPFDQVVLCAGDAATALLGPAFKPARLTRVWSHSLSAPIKETLNAPRSAVLDQRTQVSITRMGARVRVTGAAALGQIGKPGRHTELLFQILQSHFPGAADFRRHTPVWRAASLFSPDALPLVGPAAVPHTWLNLAHGHNGWSMACGAARVLADQLRGKAPELDASKLLPSRLGV